MYIYDVRGIVYGMYVCMYVQYKYSVSTIDEHEGTVNPKREVKMRTDEVFRKICNAEMLRSKNEDEGETQEIKPAP